MTNEFEWDNGEDAFPGENVPLTGDKRTEARICAVQAIFQAGAMKMDIRDSQKDFEGGRLATRKADKKLFALICGEAGEGAERYATMMGAEVQEGWDWARMDGVLKAILLAAAAELTANAGVSVAVVVNEYVNISKGFLPADQVGFVHRALDSLGKKIRG